RERNLEYQFGEAVPAVVRGSKADRQNWYRENAPYLYWNGANVGNEYDGKVYYRLNGKFEVDEDARALRIANNDPALLRRAIEDLRKNTDPESAQRAQRLLTRYTGEQHESASAWRSWLEDNEDQLFASDWNGYRFQPARGPGDADAESPARFAATAQALDKLSTLKRPAVDVALSVVADGEVARARLDFELEPGFWIYAPGSGAQFEFGVRAPAGFGYQVATDPLVPQVGEQGRLYGAFRIEVPLEGSGDVATLLVDFQACDEKLCHLPVTNARLVAKVES
ncbi:MAG: hypothetical protein OES47_14160, partial [Acidobacteriota bacterium]|nr:hypothetical protein [Acidobacteriota bacterium]